jgi:hypothetical protein
MGLIKEPKEIDFLIQSEPWSESELADFRKIMSRQKLSNKKTKIEGLSKTKIKHNA